VVEDKGFFHCFGCGAHGDAVGYLMRAENLDFIEAIERLAAEAGLAVPQQTPQERERAQRQKTLLEALAAAANFYEARLWSPAGLSPLAAAPWVTTSRNTSTRPTRRCSRKAACFTPGPRRAPTSRVAKAASRRRPSSSKAIWM